MHRELPATAIHIADPELILSVRDLNLVDLVLGPPGAATNLIFLFGRTEDIIVLST
jgi:hypothetical protein